MTKEQECMMSLALGQLTGILSTQENRWHLRSLMLSRDLHPGYVRMLRQYLDDALTGVPEPKK